MIDAQNLGAALKYGPTTYNSIQRSQYLTDALRNLQGSSEKIQSAPELGVRLLATALLSRKSQGADSAVLQSLAQDRQSAGASALAGLEPPAATPAPAMAASPAPTAPQPQATPAPAQGSYSPQDRDALVRMLYGEAGGEGDAGMTAAGSVALNRLQKHYGGADTLQGVITAPHQFEAMGRADVRGLQPTDPRYQKAQMIADALMNGQAQDPTGGALNFINPDLQLARGGHIPAWAQGQGQRIGHHVFFGGQPGGAQPWLTSQSAALPPPAPPTEGGAQPGAGAGAGLGGGVGPGNGAQPLPGQQQPQAAQQPLQSVQPFQVASNGATPMPAQPPPPPAPSPPAAEAPPVAANPATGGNASSVTPQEYALAKRLIDNPQTYDQGIAYAYELQKKAAGPTTYEVGVNNGLPYWADKQHPGQITYGQVPDAVKTHPAGADNMAGITPGSAVDVNAIGARNVVQAPPQGYQGPGGISGPVPGGPADPNNPMARLQGLSGLRGEVAGVLTLATSLRRNYSALQTGYQQQNGPGDIAMMNGLQKMIDDGVVREGDITTQLHAQGINGSIAQLTQYLASGGVFSPQIRDAMKATADSLYGNINQTYHDRVMGYQGIANRAYGPGAFEDVVPGETIKSLGWGAPDASAAGGPASAPGSGRTAHGYTHAQANKAQEIAHQGGGFHGPLGAQTNPHAPKNQGAYNAIPPGQWFIDEDGALVQKGGR